MKTPEQKITELEQRINSLLKEVLQLKSIVSFLEKENRRRRNDINQAISAINRKK